LQLPFTVCVTNVANAKPLYYCKGDLSALVTASCAVPGIFEPIVYDGQYLIDGGVTDNLPVVTKPDGSCMIGVHVNPIVPMKSYTAKEISMFSLKILINRDIVRQSKECDIFIEPPLLSEISQSLFADPKKIINIGYEYAMSMLAV
jgi:NTE family protein